MIEKILQKGMLKRQFLFKTETTIETIINLQRKIKVYLKRKKEQQHYIRKFLTEIKDIMIRDYEKQDRSYKKANEGLKE